MHDRPDPPQLLSMVRELLRDTVIPKLDPATAYQVRVASNVLAIVARQIAHGDADGTAERKGLQRLLGSGEHDLLLLNRQFADRLRDNSLDFADAGVRAHLWQTTLAKLAVDQPAYPRYVELSASH